ncbi:T9SS type A sorting domain-containing protein [Cytophaga sp. FL35]|uniref:T9SS type A sorting domain-containing protein n=1 Tax=Cytophaga sp. FL35 TaxID=1904456 RepID=UPI00165385A3|nr:T9SS type A sorting domain-containing protein [Cytophaga sp. FL35]MBC6999176.1 T9SS type A sorting domain-containing protein [Cytophaga sp. FL35]
MKHFFHFFIVPLVHFASYAQVNIEVIGDLPEEIWETSGLVYDFGRLVTHNDSSNEPILYELDTVNLTVKRRVEITNAENVDWEDVAQDDDYFYIGDIGNNRGVRRDLSILKILKKDFFSLDKIEAERIQFTYEDQLDFEDSGNSDWDAEALFVYQNEIIILTKQWKTNGTVAYSLPKTSGTHTAQKLDGYQINGLVTGATLQNEILILVGYSNLLNPFIAKITGLEKGSIFGGQIEQERLQIGISQVEAVTFARETELFISSENYENSNLSLNFKSRLYKVRFVDNSSDDSPDVENPPQETPKDSTNIPLQEHIRIKNSPTDSVLTIESDIEFGTIEYLHIFDVTGRSIKEILLPDANPYYVDVSDFPVGVYFMTIKGGKKLISKSFVVD